MSSSATKKKDNRSIKVIQPLFEMKTLPSQKDVYQRRIYLQNVNRGKELKVFLPALAKEIEESWKMQDIPVQKWSQIYTKLRKLKKNSNNDLFDCLPRKPIWKTVEDKEYYHRQKMKLGGYCSSKLVSYKIHPSKNIRQPSIVMSPKNHLKSINEEQESQKSDTLDSWSSPNSKNIDSKFAEKLKESANLSYSQTLAVMNFYCQEFPNIKEIPYPPSRARLWKIVSEENMNYHMDRYVSEEHNVLYFDMKNYPNLYGKKREIICVCIGPRLIAFEELDNKKADTIATFLLNIMEKFRISTIVSDTEPTITGCVNGVIKQIKRVHSNVIYEPCRFHILDLILKHEFSILFSNMSTSPLLPYPFVAQVHGNWNSLRLSYMSKNYEKNFMRYDLPDTENRRDDYRFLLELVKALRTWREYNKKVFVKIPFRPISMSLARWNSKAIYSLMAELILELETEKLKMINNFIVYQWAPVWFGLRDCTDWRLLTSMCEKNKIIIRKYNLENRVEEKPPINEQAERIFRMANEKINRCKSLKVLQNTLIRYVNESLKLN